MKYNPNPPIYVDETYPELVRFFENKEDAHVGKSHPYKKNMVCPCCKKVYPMLVGSLIRSGRVSCPTCNDGISYPERFMANILRSINIDFTYQYKDTWTMNHRYDFMIVVNNTKYLIEMDGGIGHGNKSVHEKYSIEDSIKIDNKKDELANQNGFILIRIDCNYTYNRFGFIKENIIKSLVNIIDLSQVDWEECNKKSLDSLVFKVVDCYRNKTKFADEISNITGINENTVINYIRRCMKNGILEKEIVINKNPFKDIPKDVKIVYEHKNLKNSKPIYCYEDNIVFGSITDVINYYQYDSKCIRSAMCQSDGYYLGKHFQHIDDLPKNFEFKEHPYTAYRHHTIYQYDKKKTKLLAIYDTNNIPSKYCYANIWRVCTNKRKSAYGYFWSYDKLQNVV